MVRPSFSHHRLSTPSWIDTSASGTSATSWLLLLDTLAGRIGGRFRQWRARRPRAAASVADEPLEIEENVHQFILYGVFSVACATGHPGLPLQPAPLLIRTAMPPRPTQMVTRMWCGAIALS